MPISRCSRGKNPFKRSAMYLAVIGLTAPFLLMISASATSAADLQLSSVELGMEASDAIEHIKTFYSGATLTETKYYTGKNFGSLTPCEDLAERGGALTAECEDELKRKLELVAAYDVDLSGGKRERIEIYTAGKPGIAAIYRQIDTASKPSMSQQIISAHGKGVDLGAKEGMIWGPSWTKSDAFGERGDPRCKDIWGDAPFPKQNIHVDCGQYLRTDYYRAVLIDSSQTSEFLGGVKAVLKEPPKQEVVVAEQPVADGAIASSRQPVLRSSGYEQHAARISGGQPFEFSDVSYLFTGGVAYELLSTCSRGNLNDDDLAEAQTFAYAVAQRAMVGNQWGNDDLGKMMGSQAQGMTVFSAGNLSARALKCEGADIILQNVATIIRSNKLGNSGGEAIFISTCSPVHGEAGCGCLARLGSAVYPNIYQLQYSHDLMAGIVQGNPIVALQIVGACGIMNY
ncbi:hypothetical protein LJR030_004113 [Rhizobium sp. LjRoot30]|uniref:hypothetical protein n=1 Tax=Rhizobium sp. LjRoot30 TaxID=3342320 RepID=UPI003ED0120D